MNFKSLFNSVKDLFDGGKTEEAKKKLQEAIDQAIADGDVTAEEMAEIKKLQVELKLDDEVLNEIKIKVLQNLMDKISAKGEATPEEWKLFNEVKGDLGITVVEKDNTLESIKAGIGQAMDKLGHGAQHLKAKVKDMMTDDDGKSKIDMGEIGHKAKGIFDKVKDKVVDGVKDLSDKAKDVFTDEKEIKSEVVTTTTTTTETKTIEPEKPTV